MSVNSQKEGELEEKVEVSLRKKCVNCLKGPNLIKALIVLVCVATCVEQLTSCIGKLIRKPITTHTHFDFNKTLLYPSVTFCREPAYKYSGLQKHGLYPHPYFSSIWRNFPFENVTLNAVWEDITFTQQDFFVQYGLSASSSNVEVIGTLGLVNGRCFTLKPKILVSQASRATGYSVTLQHTADDLATSTSLYPPGYHVFIHYMREPYTEVEVHNGGLVEYLYVKTGEEVDVKLTVDQYHKLSEEDDLCTYQSNYSANQCTTEYVWELVEGETGCSGPWMVSDLPRCNNFTTMRNLITAYMKYYLDHDHDHCPRFCRSYLYNSFVTNRQDSYLWDSATKQWAVRSGDAALQTQMYIHFNSMMVSVYEERYNYDWNLFISDLGGSVGFLLGLSVLSLMSIFGKLWSRLIRPFIRSPKSKKDATSISNSILTVDLKSPKTYGFEKKCNDWSSKNESLKL